jgi:outer membrane protein insertion porin family
LSFDQEVAGLGGSSRFVRSRGTAKIWRAFFDDSVVASAEIEGGTLFTFGKNSRVTERFFLGGDRFRGFADEGIGPRDLENDDDALGGNLYSVARFEVSFPLGLPEELGIYGGLFTDVGTLWGLDRTSYPATGDALAVNVDDSAIFRASAGALLFLDTPFGPLQLSFGFPIVKKSYDENELFRLTLGTRF